MPVAEVISLSQSLQPLVAQFNHERGKARIIVLVSPT